MRHCRPARETPETQMTKHKRHNDLQARQNYQGTDEKKIATNSSLYILYRPNVLRCRPTHYRSLIVVIPMSDPYLDVMKVQQHITRSDCI